MVRRSLAALAIGASFVAFAAPASAGPPQVTIYLPGYGQPASPPAQQPSPAQASSAAANAQAAGAITLQAEVAVAQATAYQRYLTYVALANSPAARAGGADPSQYFSNGAAATTVPAAGQPGSGYFSNGAEVTRVPAPPAQLAPSAVPPPPPPAQASQPSQALPPSAPLAPFWWVEGSTPATSPEVDVAASSPPAAPQPEPSDARPAMSFAEWLQSMGADEQETAAADAVPTLTSGEVDVTPIAEPAAAAFEVRPRVRAPLREKPRERVGAGGGTSDVAFAMIGTFAAGLLIGAVAMKRLRSPAP